MMKVLVLALLSLGSIAGCLVDDQAPPPSDSFGQVEQNVGEPCSGHYTCALGQSCSPTTSTCQYFFVVGPTTNACIDTMQCQYQYSWNSYCYYGNPQGTYGECRLY